MGISFTNWNEVTAYFMFADQPGVLMVLAAMVGLSCIGLIASIKRHEDEAFAKHLQRDRRT